MKWKNKEMFNGVLCVCKDAFPEIDRPLFWNYSSFYEVVVAVDGTWFGVLF